jgi:hypothetical protein
VDDHAIGNRVYGYVPCKLSFPWKFRKVGEKSLTSVEEKGEGSSLEGERVTDLRMENI